VRNIKPTTYTIFEYNKENQSYTLLGQEKGLNSKEACQQLAKKIGWKKKKDTCLFGQFPICR